MGQSNHTLPDQPPPQLVLVQEPQASHARTSLNVQSNESNSVNNSEVNERDTNALEVAEHSASTSEETGNNINMAGFMENDKDSSEQSESANMSQGLI